MSDLPVGEEEDEPNGDDEVLEERSWLYNHIGRLSGMVLGVILFGFIAFLAAVGFRPALGLLIVLVVGVILISLGSQMRGGR